MSGATKLNVDHLSEQECERILDVLQRDYHLRTRERIRLRQLALSIKREQLRRELILSSNRELKPSLCLCCLKYFSPFFSRPVVCFYCTVLVCLACCKWLPSARNCPACSWCAQVVPEDNIPVSSAKPPKPPRTYMYGSQPAGLNNMSNSPSLSSSLQQSLEKFNTASTTTATSYKRRYGSEQALNLNNNYEDSYVTSHKESPNEMYLRRIDSYQKKYGSQSSLYGSTNSLASTTPTHNRFCSQCGDQLSPNAKRRAECYICKQWICKLCAAWEPRFDSYICEQHEHEEGIEEYNRNSTDWSYDITEKKFIRTQAGELSDSIHSRLHNGSASSVDDDLNDLSLAAFDQSVGSSLVPTSTDVIAQDLGNQIQVEDFFSARPSTIDTSISVDLSAKLSQLDADLSKATEVANQQLLSSEGVTFDELKEKEVKSFLCEINKLIKKVRLSLEENDSNKQIEELLSYHKSTISALIANLEQALHLAVDRQTCPTALEVVKHSDVSSVVCKTIRQFTGEELPDDVLPDSRNLNYGAAAAVLLDKIMEDLEPPSERTSSNKTRAPSSFSTRSIDSSATSDYGSYKLPSFNSNGGTSDVVDPDMLSMSHTSTMDLIEESEEDAFSENSSQWDTDSVASASSSNWFFRTKVPQYDDISSKSSIFNTQSTSEESLSMFIPQHNSSVNSQQRDLDTLSDLTLGSDSDLLAEDEDEPLTPRIDESEIINSSRNTDLAAEQTLTSGGVMTSQHGLNRSIVRKDSISRTTSSSSASGSRALSDFTEDGEESTVLRFTTKPRSQSAPRGDVAKFTCSVSGDGTTDVYWFKEDQDDSVAIESDDKYEVTSQDDKYSLEIYNVTDTDYGQYLCLAKNDTTSSHWLFGLQVEESSTYEEKTPLFLKELYDMEAVEGETVKFRCKVRAYPPPRVMWFKDGKRLQHGENYKLEKFGNRDYMLTIHHVTSEHDAEFTVVAKNCAGEAKSTAQLLVELEGDPEPKSAVVKNGKLESDKQRGASLKDNSKVQVTQVQTIPSTTKVTTQEVNSLKPESKRPGTLPVVPTVKSKPAPTKQAASSISIPAPTNSGVPADRKSGDLVSGIGPRRSLRAAMRKSDDVVPSTTEVKTQMKTTTSSKAESISPIKSEATPEVKLLSVKPLHTEFNSQSHTHEERTDTTSNKTTDSPQSSKLSKVTTPSVPTETKSPEKHITMTTITTNQSKIAKPIPEPEVKNDEPGVDIQPGYVREKQYAKLGDVTKIEPSVKLKKASPTTLEANKHITSSSSNVTTVHLGKATLTTDFLSSNSKNNGGNNKTRTVPSDINSITTASNPSSPADALHNLTQRMAPQPPVVTELKGSTSPNDIPTSRSEWEQVVPSVLQRRQSFERQKSIANSKLQPSKETAAQPKPNCHNTTQPKDVKTGHENKTETAATVTKAANTAASEQRVDNSKLTNGAVNKTAHLLNGEQNPGVKGLNGKKYTAPQPPISTTGKSDQNPNKTIKKVVKRTVSIKRSTIPATTFDENPPNDGHDYIKICGRWVQMKKERAAAQRKSSSSSSPRENKSPPPPPAEWEGEVKVGEVMKEFRKEQEGNGKIITGRNLGPITSV